jgi:hypothetical protein
VTGLFYWLESTFLITNDATKLHTEICSPVKEELIVENILEYAQTYFEGGKVLNTLGNVPFDRRSPSRLTTELNCCTESVSPSKEIKSANRGSAVCFSTRSLGMHGSLLWTNDLTYTQNLMGPKVVIAILVLALAGANSFVASVCAAYCVLSAALHHHQMESQPAPTGISHHMHAHHDGAQCVECPPESENSLNQKADCSSLVQIQAIKEGTFSLDAPSGVAQFDVADTPVDTFALAGGGERSMPFHAAHRFRNSNPTSVPLRI